MKTIAPKNIGQLQKWSITLGSGLSLFCVLYIFRGYHIEEGISASGHSLFIRASLFALLSSFIFYLFEVSLSRKLSQKWLRHLLAVCTGALTTFLLFNYFWRWSEWTFYAFSLLLFEYSIVMLFPILLSYAISWKQKSANPSLQGFIHLKAEGSKHHLSLRPKDLLFIKAADNYAEVHYRKNGELKQELLRTKLKKLELEHEEGIYLKRCHRSYLVNPQNIEQQLLRGGKMKLRIGHIQIPVSQTYQTAFTPAP
jgi:hypothetical protein